MAVRELIRYPDPRLRQRALPVERFDAALAALIDDLFDTLYASSGIGLSAPQLGVAAAVLVMDLSPDRSRPEHFVNPTLLARSVPGLVEERCLSVPGVVGNVVRATAVRVRAQHRSGEVFERALEGMAAVCLQHEMDHLAGRLFIDRLPWWRRLGLRLGQRRRDARASAA